MSAPYTGFEPLSYEAARSIQNDRDAVETMVRIAQRFMREQAPLMAFAAGLLPNPHRAVDDETVEEGMGGVPHRILVSRRLKASFVVCPMDLTADDAAPFMESVVPAGEHLVIAAKSYDARFRFAISAGPRRRVTLLTFAGTEDKPAYEIFPEN